MSVVKFCDIGVRFVGTGRTGNKTLVERLVGKILVMLLEMLFRWADKFHGNKLVAAFSISSRTSRRAIDLPSLLKSGDDLSNESTLNYATSATSCTMGWLHATG